MPLYFYDPKDAAPHTALLNEVFWYVFRDVAGWQSMGMMACDNAARIDDMTTTKFPPVPASLTGPALNECPKIPKTFIAYLVSMLALTPYQSESAKDTRADALASTNFEKSLDQFNKLDEKAFQQFLQVKMKKWLQDFSQMVPAEDAEGVKAVDMAAFAAWGGGMGLSVSGLQYKGQCHFWTINELPVLNPAFEPLAGIIS